MEGRNIEEIDSILRNSSTWRNSIVDDISISNKNQRRT